MMPAVLTQDGMRFPLAGQAEAPEKIDSRSEPMSSGWWIGAALPFGAAFWVGLIVILL